MNPEPTPADKAKRAAAIQKRRAELRKLMARNVALLNAIVRKKVAAGTK